MKMAKAVLLSIKTLLIKHSTFAPGAGDFPASEKETRACSIFYMMRSMYMQ